MSDSESAGKLSDHEFMLTEQLKKIDELATESLQAAHLKELSSSAISFSTIKSTSATNETKIS